MLAVPILLVLAFAPSATAAAAESSENLEGFCNKVVPSKFATALQYLWLGDCFRLGIGRAYSLEDAVENYLYAARDGEVGGWIWAGEQLLFYATDNESYARGLSYLEKAYELGAVMASTKYIAMLYLTGRVVDQDTDKGLDYLGKSAEVGYQSALATFYYLYSRGVYGVAKDPHTAGLYLSIIQAMNPKMESPERLDELMEAIENNFLHIASNEG